MAAELIILPVLALLLFGWGVFFSSAMLYRQQQREEKWLRLRARWEGVFRTPEGHVLAVRWSDDEGCWIAALSEAPNRRPLATIEYFHAHLRGDTMTVTVSASGTALDLRFLDDSLLVSPLVPGLHGDTSVEQDWLADVLSGPAPRWTRVAA